MSSRLLLHTELIKCCDNVYFDPPESLRMKYPCIVYSRSSSRSSYANDKTYSYRQGYQVTVIDRDPDTEIPVRLLRNLSFISFVREYVYDNLHHMVFRIYY